jgi:hypothetical protein
MVGALQIDERLHAAAARKMGFDIYTSEGNWGYAQWLFQHYGTAPWLATRKCWRGSSN